MRGLIGGTIERVKALTGVYSLGFERESMMGIMLPVGFVVVVGAVGWAFIKLFL